MNIGQPNKRVDKLNKEREQRTAEHTAYVKFLEETILGKLCLVGIQAQGINPTFVTSIVGEMTGAIALALSTDKSAAEDGMYFDLRQLTIYKVYNEADTKRITESWATEKTPRVLRDAPDIVP